MSVCVRGGGGGGGVQASNRNMHIGEKESTWGRLCKSNLFDQY